MEYNTEHNNEGSIAGLVRTIKQSNPFNKWQETTSGLEYCERDDRFLKMPIFTMAMYWCEDYQHGGKFASVIQNIQSVATSCQTYSSDILETR